MSLLCYNKGCGQRFDPDNNPEGKIIQFPNLFDVFLTVWSGVELKLNVGRLK